MELVYLFDYRESAGNLLPFRIPTVVARFVCKFLPYADYWQTDQF